MTQNNQKLNQLLTDILNHLASSEEARERFNNQNRLVKCSTSQSQLLFYIEGHYYLH
jgi:hypothetical protein